MPSALVRSCVEQIWIAGIHVDFIETGVLRDVEQFLPSFATVLCTVDTAVATGFPKRTIGRHVNNVLVCWMDGNHADVLRVWQAHVLP